MKAPEVPQITTGKVFQLQTRVVRAVLFKTMACIFHELIFTDPVDITIEEGSELRLQFEEPAPPGSYEDIKWYKGSTNGYDRIVHFIEGTIFNYWGDYCSSASPCDASNKSDKGELDTHTGTFTIHQVKLSDTSYYYYAFYSGITGDTGNNYEYIVDVYGRFIMKKSKGIVVCF